MDFVRASITLPTIHGKTLAKVIKRNGMSKKTKEVLAHPNKISIKYKRADTISRSLFQSYSLSHPSGNPIALGSTRENLTNKLHNFKLISLLGEMVSKKYF